MHRRRGRGHRCVTPGLTGQYRRQTVQPRSGGPLSRPTLTRARGSNPLPEGTLEVGVGLVIAGVTAYGFTVVAARALGKTAYAPLSVLWALVFVAGPGFFLPIEQEVSRALAARRARGLGTGPVIRRAALFGSLIAILLLVLLLIVSPLMVDNLFNGEWLLFVGLVLGMLGFAVEYLARGTFSGLGRFRPVFGRGRRRGAVAVPPLRRASPWPASTYAGWYGIALGIAPASRRAHRAPRAARHGDRRARRAVVRAVDRPRRAAGQLRPRDGARQRRPDRDEDPGRQRPGRARLQFFTAVIIARIPLFLFQAIQAALLPKLSALASAGKFDEFRIGFRKLVAVVAGVGCGRRWSPRS